MNAPQEVVDLYSRHSRRVFSYILTPVPRSYDADEVFQETSRVLWQKFSEYQSGTSFAAWARKVAHNCAMTRRQKQKRYARLFSEEFVSAIRRHLDQLLGSGPQGWQPVPIQGE